MVAAVVAGLVLATIAALSLQAPGFALRAAEWSALRFTVGQAALSALVSSALAVPLARALARRQFPLRRALLTLLGAPFLLPVVVAVLGLLAIFGRAGWLNTALAGLGLPQVSVYGLHGVVLAHVFLNLPLATRMILLGWHAIPAERFRLADSLGLGPAAQRRHLEMPMLRQILPGVAAIVFVICLSSFVVALTLGGGPRATTLELAIYQALRFDFDLGRAALLALAQFALCSTAVLAASRLTLPPATGPGMDRSLSIAGPPGWRRSADAAVIAAATLFLLLPIAALLLDGLRGLGDLPQTVWRAAATSLIMASLSAALSTGTALCLALSCAARGPGAALIEQAAMLPLAVSSLVFGTGLFLLIRGALSPQQIALPLTIVTNALTALPFVFRILLPPARVLHADYDRLAAALNLTGLNRLRVLTLPRLSRSIGLGAGIAAVLSLGDLGVITLFADPATTTLPLLIARLTGSYHTDQAAGVALILLALGVALFRLCDWIGEAKGHHDAAP